MLVRINERANCRIPRVWFSVRDDFNLFTACTLVDCASCHRIYDFHKTSNTSESQSGSRKEQANPWTALEPLMLLFIDQSDICRNNVKPERTNGLTQLTGTYIRPLLSRPILDWEVAESQLKSRMKVAESRKKSRKVAESRAGVQQSLQNMFQI